MSAALAWILKNPLLVAAAVLLAALGAQTVRLNLAQASLRAAQADLAVARVTGEALQSSVAKQNAAVRGLVAYGKAVQADLDKATAANKLMSAAHKREIARLRAAPVPKDCAGAVAWGAEQGRAIGKAFNEAGGPSDAEQ